MGVRSHPRRRRRSRTLRAVAIVLALLLFARFALDPNRSWMKREIQAYVLSTTGLEIDYRWMDVDLLSGFAVDALVVRTPPDLRPIASDLVRAAHVDLRWSLADRRVTSIALSDVDLAVVIDENGRTSLDTIFPPGDLPLSRRAANILESTTIADRLDVVRADIEIVWARDGHVVHRERVHDAGATFTATSNRIHASAGPLEIRWMRDGNDMARARLLLEATLTASSLDATLDLELLEQSFGPDLELGTWRARGGARFGDGTTSVDVDRVTSPAGDVTVAAAIDVPDSGPPFVRHAHGDANVARLRPWIPEGLLPIAAESGTVHVDVASATLAKLPRLAEGGFLRLDSDLANVAIRTSSGTLDLDHARGAIELRPASGAGFALQGWQEIDAASIERVRARDLAIVIDGHQAEDGSLTGVVDLLFGEIARRGARFATIARNGQCHVIVGRLEANGAARIDAIASGVLEVSDRARPLVSAPTRANVDVRDVAFDASRGTVRASFDVGRDRVSVDAAKQADAIDYAIQANLIDALALRSLLSPARSGAIDLRSKGRILASTLSITHDTSLSIESPTFANVSARTLDVKVHSEGTTARHSAEASLRASGLLVDGTYAGDDALAISTSWDRDRRSLRLNASLDGSARALLDLSASFDEEARALIFDASAEIAEVGALARRLRGLDLDRLELAAAAHGKLFGVASAVGRDGTIELAPDPWRTAAIDGAADVRVTSLRWNRAGVALGVPAATWHGDIHPDRTIAMHSEIPVVHLGLGRHQIDLEGLSDDTTATVTGDLLDPSVRLSERGTIRALEQDFVLVYPKTDVAIALSLLREPDGLLQISQLHVATGAGTTADVRGGIDLGARRRRLSVSAEVAQDLLPLSFAPARFSGSGTVKVAGSLESPDLASYRTRADVSASKVDLRIPSFGIEARAIDAAIPVRMDFDVVKDDVRIRRTASDAHDRYAMHRFPDQLALSRRPGSFFIGRLRTPRFEIAPISGNLIIDQNVVSLPQLEVGVRGGWLSGEASVDWNEASSSIEAHLRSRGVQSKHGEPFDANLAITLSARDRSIEGRLEVVRMGKQHLLDMLDVADPLHTDTAMNGVRGALDFGYPSRVHVGFHQGFANAHVELGGLARFASIDDIRDVPTGLLIDRLVKSALENRRTP